METLLYLAQKQAAQNDETQNKTNKVKHKVQDHWAKNTLNMVTRSTMNLGYKDFAIIF